MDIKFYNELAKPSEFSKELLEEFLATGYAVEQKIDGVTYIKMSALYYEDLGEYVTKHPRELCKDYWTKMVDENKNCDIMSFIKRLCEVHTFIKELTHNEVDFCGTIGEELNG